MHFPRFLDLFAVFSPQALLDVKLAWAFAVWDFDGKRLGQKMAARLNKGTASLDNILDASAGDDLIGANDMKLALQLLCNGGVEEPDEPAAQTESQPMFDDDQSTDTLQQDRRTSVHRDLLSSHELSQVCTKCNWRYFLGLSENVEYSSGITKDTS